MNIGCDGSLWNGAKLVRENYARHHRTIGTAADFKASLRAGPRAWPGCYAVYFVTSDGAALSYHSARREARLIIGSIRDRCDDGWRVVGMETMAEWDDDAPPICDHSGLPIG